MALKPLTTQPGSRGFAWRRTSRPREQELTRVRAAARRAAVRARPLAWTGTTTASSSTRRRSCARRRGRSSSFRSCRSARAACACRSSSATRRPSGSRPRTRCLPEDARALLAACAGHSALSTRQRPGRRPARMTCSSAVCVAIRRRERPLPARRLRQPPQGRGSQRDSDRRARPRVVRRRRPSPDEAGLRRRLTPQRSPAARILRDAQDEGPTAGTSSVTPHSLSFRPTGCISESSECCRAREGGECRIPG